MNKIGWAIFLISLGYEWPGEDVDVACLHRLDGSEVCEITFAEYKEAEKIIFRYGN